jgi:hypothetical protein
MFPADFTVAGTKQALEHTGSDKNEIVEFRFGSVVCLDRRDDKNGKSRGWLRLRASADSGDDDLPGTQRRDVQSPRPL